MTVLYPPIQEEMVIRRNIALGPSGLGQYFSVFSSPLGLGGTIRTLCTRSCPPQARAIKLRIALVLVEWSHAGGGEINIDLGKSLGPRGVYFPIHPSSRQCTDTLYTRSLPPARAIKLCIALVLVEWSHAGGGETNIDLGQYWLLAAWHACIPPQRAHQKLYSVPNAADKQLLTTVVN